MIRPNYLQVIGHSLGGHISGFIGKTLYKLSGFEIKPSRITALDPAGPLFTNTRCPGRVCSSDGDWVTIFHSNGGGLGHFGTIFSALLDEFIHISVQTYDKY